MEKIKFDSGVKEYKLGEGVLRFNPGDPNVYARFAEAVEQMKDLEKLFLQPQENKGLFELLTEADKKIKELLSWVFGSQNDFDSILGGVNVLAVTSKGKRVIMELFEVLQPVLLEGAQKCAGQITAQAVKRAESRRANQ